MKHRDPTKEKRATWDPSIYVIIIPTTHHRPQAPYPSQVHIWINNWHIKQLAHDDVAYGIPVKDSWPWAAPTSQGLLVESSLV